MNSTFLKIQIIFLKSHNFLSLTSLAYVKHYELTKMLNSHLRYKSLLNSIPKHFYIKLCHLSIWYKNYWDKHTTSFPWFTLSYWYWRQDLVRQKDLLSHNIMAWQALIFRWPPLGSNWTMMRPNPKPFPCLETHEASLPLFLSIPFGRPTTN
jgi:hypothetical protein